MNSVPLEKLIALIAADNKEVARMEKIIIELKEEDATLLKALEIDDRDQVKTLSNIRLKTEIAESKCPQLQNRLQGLYAQLLKQCEASALELNREVDAKVEAATQKLSEALLPFASDPGGAGGMAERMKRDLEGPIQKLMNLHFTGVWEFKDNPIQCANQILSNWATLSTFA